MYYNLRIKEDDYDINVGWITVINLGSQNE